MAASEHEPSLGQRGERVLEGAEVATYERVDRPTGRTGRSDPAPEHGRSRLLRGLVEEVEQDRQLGPMLELAGEQRERIDVEHAAQLVVAQPEQLHQPGRAIALGA